MESHYVALVSLEFDIQYIDQACLKLLPCAGSKGIHSHMADSFLLFVCVHV